MLPEVRYTFLLLDVFFYLRIGFLLFYYVIGMTRFYLTNNKLLYLIYSDLFRNHFSSRLVCSGISANLHSGQIIPKHQWMIHGEHYEGDFGFLTVTGLTRCSSRGYRKKIHFLL